MVHVPATGEVSIVRRRGIDGASTPVALSGALASLSMAEFPSVSVPVPALAPLNAELVARLAAQARRASVFESKIIAQKRHQNRPGVFQS